MTGDELQLRAGDSSDVSVFVSYARIDDRATHGRISHLIEDVKNMYESDTGLTVGIFQDVESIRLGELFRERIRSGLASSSILVAFVTPAYLRSTSCREELTEYHSFLVANKIQRIIFPLAFADPEVINRDFGSDDLWITLREYQYLPVSTLRTSDRGTSQWMMIVQEIAASIANRLRAQAERQVESDSTDSAPDDIPEQGNEGLYEMLARMEERAPSGVDDLGRATRLIERFSEESATATEALGRSNSFGQRLALSNDLARRLSPIAAEMSDTVDDLLANFDAYSSGIGAVIEIVRRYPTQSTEEGILSFMDAVRDMATVGVRSLDSLDSFEQALAEVIGFSATLDRPVRKMRAVVMKMAQLRGMFTSWLNELDALDRWIESLGDDDELGEGQSN